MKSFLHVGLVFVLALVLSGCVGSTTQGGTLGVNRTQLMLVSSETMNAEAVTAYTEVINEAKAKNTLNTDKAMYNKLNLIGKNLIAHVGVFREDAKSWNWEINLIKEDTVNAWCMPGGKIVFYSGIIEQLKLTDDEIAAIMGHEMAHALREHSAERASQEQAKSIGLSAIQSVTKASDTTMQMANMAAYYTFSLPYSRKHESESDIIGVELMARAGYNPYAAVSLWEKMAKVSPSSTPEFLSTHPSAENRAAELNKAAANVMELYNSAKK